MGQPTAENGHFGLLKKGPNFLKDALRAVWQWNELAKLTAGGGALLAPPLAVSLLSAAEWILLAADVGIARATGTAAARWAQQLQQPRQQEQHGAMGGEWRSIAFAEVAADAE